MNAQGIIRKVQENTAEYLEMAENPLEFISWVLAEKLAKQNDRVEHLERINQELYANMRRSTYPGKPSMARAKAMENN